MIQRSSQVKVILHALEQCETNLLSQSNIDEEQDLKGSIAKNYLESQSEKLRTFFNLF